MSFDVNFPMCWKCSSRIITGPVASTAPVHVIYTLTGCKECKDIKDYDSAKQLCPLLKEVI